MRRFLLETEARDAEAGSISQAAVYRDGVQVHPSETFRGNDLRPLQDLQGPAGSIQHEGHRRHQHNHPSQHGRHYDFDNPRPNWPPRANNKEPGDVSHADHDRQSNEEDLQRSRRTSSTSHSSVFMKASDMIEVAYFPVARQGKAKLVDVNSNKGCEDDQRKDWPLDSRGLDLDNPRVQGKEEDRTHRPHPPT